MTASLVNAPATLPHVNAVILAGGVGNRFLPYSTPECPKQFLHITDAERTMIQMTYDRITKLVPAERVFVSTNDRYVSLVASQLPALPPHNIVGEPKKKSTAPAIGMLNAMIHHRDPDAIAFFLPSDHYIADTEGTLRAYTSAVALAHERSTLITFGIVPTFPSPEFGYIEHSATPHASGAYEATEFKEKPNVAVAQEYLNKGNYFWNGGMFVWRTTALMTALERHMPQMAAQLSRLSYDVDGGVTPASLGAFFDDVESTSIDYGVMEKAALTGGVMTFPFDVGWSDVGTWKGLADLAQSFNLELPDVVTRHLSEHTA